MDAVKPAAPADGRIGAQVPAFAAIGVIGYFVDAEITFACAKYVGLPPELARPPGFIIATIVNFALNRAITLRHCARAPPPRLPPLLGGGLGRARGQLRGLFGLRYFSPRRRDRRCTPAILPLFVAAGSGVAMVLTFIGFRSFAFRH